MNFSLKKREEPASQNLLLKGLVMTVRATDILKAVQNLNPAEKHRLREYLIDSLTASSSTGNILLEISERKNKSGYRCPDCESEHAVRFGKYSTIVEDEEVKKQRYQYKACKITFTDLTNTVLYRTRRLNQWIKFVECMIEGYSLRKLMGRFVQKDFITYRTSIITTVG